MEDSQCLEYDEDEIIKGIRTVLEINFKNNSLNYLKKILGRDLSDEEVCSVEDILYFKIEEYVESLSKNSDIFDMANDLEFELDDIKNDIEHDMEHEDERELMEELDSIEVEEEDINFFGIPKKEKESEIEWDEAE
jgi:hypothetical protein